MLNALAFCIAVGLTAHAAFAQTPPAVVADFRASAEASLAGIRGEASFAGLVDMDKLAAEMGSATVVAVEGELDVGLGEFEQSSTAENIKSTQTIRVNSARWMAIGDERVKEALALHEYLSLLGLESTGDYAISERWLFEEYRADSP